MAAWCFSQRVLLALVEKPAWPAAGLRHRSRPCHSAWNTEGGRFSRQTSTVIAEVCAVSIPTRARSLLQHGLAIRAQLGGDLEGWASNSRPAPRNAASRTRSLWGKRVWRLRNRLQGLGAKSFHSFARFGPAKASPARDQDVPAVQLDLALGRMEVAHWIGGPWHGVASPRLLPLRSASQRITRTTTARSKPGVQPQTGLPPEGSAGSLRSLRHSPSLGRCSRKSMRFAGKGRDFYGEAAGLLRVKKNLFSINQRINRYSIG